jgi:RNA polymerase sigma factor (TIGR02999 family)
MYDELHWLAQRELRRSGGGASLSATTLLHEAYLNMSGRDGFADRGQFMAYAARAMRGLIIDFARRRHAQKRGGNLDIVALDTEIADNMPDDARLPRIGDALEELAQFEPTLAQVVDLRFFCGLSLAEIASLRGVSERTVQRDWEKARIYLHRTLRDEGPAG